MEIPSGKLRLLTCSSCPEKDSFIHSLFIHSLFILTEGCSSLLLSNTAEETPSRLVGFLTSEQAEAACTEEPSSTPCLHGKPLRRNRSAAITSASQSNRLLRRQQRLRAFSHPPVGVGMRPPCSIILQTTWLRYPRFSAHCFHACAPVHDAIGKASPSGSLATAIQQS